MSDLSYPALLAHIEALGKAQGLTPKEIAYSAWCVADLTVPRSEAFRQATPAEKDAVWQVVKHTALLHLSVTPVEQWRRLT